jgi:hypothetical protein
MKQQEPRRWLLELTFKAVKYFLLALAGCAIAYIVALVLECTVITAMIAIAAEHLLPRALVLIGCLASTAVITESVRY